MAHVTVSDGRVCVIKVSGISSTREGLEILKNTIVDLTTKAGPAKSQQDTFLLIDLSPFTVINSNLIGVFGSIVMDDNIKLLGLCGVQHSVSDILKRFGVLSETGSKGKKDIKNATKTEKVIAFRTIEEGLAFLAP